MKRSQYFIWLGISGAAGTALGMLVDRKHPAKGSFLGAVAGVVAGSVAAVVHLYVASREKVPYYSKSSPLYDETGTI